MICSAVPTLVGSYSEALVSGVCYGVWFLMSSLSDNRYSTLDIERLINMCDLIYQTVTSIYELNENLEFLIRIRPVSLQCCSPVCLLLNRIVFQIIEFCGFLNSVLTMCKFSDALSISGSLMPAQTPTISAEDE